MTRFRLLGVCAALVAAAGCSASLDTGHHGAAGAGATGSVGTGLGGRSGGFAGAGGAGGTTFIGPRNNEVDILFMIDDSSEMTSMQEKLYAQLPLFVQSLQNLPLPPSLHIAVVSSDMGAPGDSTTSIQCTKLGDQGQFQSSARSRLDAESARDLHEHHDRDASGGTGQQPHVHLGRRHDAELQRSRHLQGAPVHRAPRRYRMRVRAPAGVDRSRAGRRRPVAQHERQLPAARGRPRPS